ncbi:MAG: sulfotransferase, partial [Deltaproteobacteria bacterium]|nr:sulfotransferase [Deltaproteobacteria bacterium]
LGTARGIYEKFDIELTSEAEAALVNQVENNPKGKHGAHRYTLEQYGLSADKVKGRLAGYIDRFELGAS